LPAITPRTPPRTSLTSRLHLSRISETSKRRAAQWRDSAKPFYNLGRMIYSLDGLTCDGIAMLTGSFEKKTLSGKAADNSALEQET
jgi:hypothetical protein